MFLHGWCAGLSIPALIANLRQETGKTTTTGGVMGIATRLGLPSRRALGIVPDREHFDPAVAQEVIERNRLELVICPKRNVPFVRGPMSRPYCPDFYRRGSA